MEELTPQWEAVFERTDGVDIEAYIRNKIPDALSRILLNVSCDLLTPVDIGYGLVPVKNQDGSGQVVLPDDVLRITSFKMKGWIRPVTRFIDQFLPSCELQYNLYTRGGSSKPVCVLGKNDIGQVVIDYYSLSPSVPEHEIEYIRGVLVPDKSADSFDINPLLVSPVCYLCAALVYEILARPDMAAIMMQRSVY